MTNPNGGDGQSGRRVNTAGGQSRPSAKPPRLTKDGLLKRNSGKTPTADKPKAPPAGQYTQRQIAKFLAADRIVIRTETGNSFRLTRHQRDYGSNWSAEFWAGGWFQEGYRIGKSSMLAMIQESKSCLVVDDRST